MFFGCFIIPVISSKDPFGWQEGKYDYQKIDHFSLNSSRFTQYYSFLEINQTNDSPKDSTKNAIIYLGDEFPFNSAATTISSNLDNSFLARIQNETGSTIFRLEQRFTGKSLPLNGINPNNIKFLTVDQILEDIACFILHEVRENLGYNNILIMGGSFPGSLASWFRGRFPTIANFSYSSSSPILFKETVPGFDQVISSILLKIPHCYGNTRDLIKLIDSYIQTNPEGFAKNIGLNTSIHSNYDNTALFNMFFHYLSYITKYGPSLPLLEEYCQNQISAPNIKNFFSSFKYFLHNFTSFSNSEPFYDYSLTINAGTDEGIHNRVSSLYLSCTELGWFEVYDSQSTLIPSNISFDYYKNVCMSNFQIDISNLKQKLDAKNQRYGGLNPYVMNSIFSLSELDGWNSLMLHDSRGSIDRSSVYFNDYFALADLFMVEEPDQTDILSQNRDLILSSLNKWMNNFCGKKCSGKCVIQKCMCDDKHAGEYCEIAIVKESLFKTFSSISVLVPTIIMIIIGLSAWFLFRQDRSETEIKTLN